jgi:nicotinate-nucleotide pyrophosphorylase (carboxylating)
MPAWEGPDPADVFAGVRSALAEDIGPGDLTAALVPEQQCAGAIVVSRQRAVICGQPWVEEVFRQLDTSVTIDWLIAEGDEADADTPIAELTGPARSLLTGERTALNFLQMLSGTATKARRCVEIVAGTGVRILDTRKTIPGLRLAQKYAVRCGGAVNHRIGLFDAVLIKENHIVAAGGIAPAVAAAIRSAGDVLIEVEVETLAQTRDALASGAQRLLLDNFSLSETRNAVMLRDGLNPSVALEASGGITAESLREVAETGVDFISVGSLTKHVEAVDLSMRFSFGA